MLLDDVFTKRLKYTAEDMGSTIMSLPSVQSLRQRESSISYEETPAASSTSQFKIRLADRQGVRQQASLLIQTRYAQRGYEAQKLNDNSNRMTVVAYEGEAAIGTVSIGFDSPAGLLCDQLYRHEIDVLRANGRRVCEFTKFAAKSASASINIVAALFHIAFIYAHRIHGFDDVVIEVTPQHMKFYKRALGFKQIGTECINPRVNTAGVLLHCEFDYIGEQLQRFGGRIEMRHEEKSIYPYGFSPKEEEGLVNRIYSLPDQ